MKTWRLARPSAVALAVVSPFAFVATSYPPPYVVRNSAAVDLVREASAERQIEEAFDDIAERHSLDCRQCAAVTDGRVYEARGRRGLMLVASLDASSGALYYDVRASKRGREERAARELHADVRQALEGRFPEMALIGIDGWRIETVRLLVEHVDAVEARGGPDTAADEVWRIVHRASQARGLRVDEQYGRVLYAGRLLGPTVFDRELVVTAGYHAKNVHAVQLVRSSDGVEALERSLSADLERLLRAAFPAARLYVNREPGWRGR